MTGSDEEARELLSTMMGALTTTAHDDQPHDANEVGSKDEATNSKNHDWRGVRFYDKPSEEMDERDLRIKSSADHHENLLRNAPEWLYCLEDDYVNDHKKDIFLVDVTKPDAKREMRSRIVGLMPRVIWVAVHDLKTQYNAAKTIDGFDTGPWQEEKKDIMSKADYQAEKKKWQEEHKDLDRRCQVVGKLAGDVAEVVQDFGIDRALETWRIRTRRVADCLTEHCVRRSSQEGKHVDGIVRVGTV